MTDSPPDADGPTGDRLDADGHPETGAVRSLAAAAGSGDLDPGPLAVGAVGWLALFLAASVGSPALVFAGVVVLVGGTFFLVAQSRSLR